MRKSLLFLLIAVAFRMASQSWSTVGTPSYFTNVQAFKGHTLAFYNNEPYVVYYDSSTTNYGIKVMRCASGNWVQFGYFPGFLTNPITMYHVEMVFDQVGNLYLAVYNGQYNFDIYKYDVTFGFWTGAGSPMLSNLDWFSIAADTLGGPYIAYQENSSLFTKANVIHLPKDSMNWINVGPANFSNNYANNIRMVLDKSGTPYVGYDDYNNVQYQTTVQKFNGNNWVNLNIPVGASTGGFLDMGIDSLNKLYVFYFNDVLTYNGTSWSFSSTNVPNGTAGFYNSYHVSRSGEQFYGFTQISPPQLKVYMRPPNTWPMVATAVPLIYTQPFTIATDIQGAPYVFYSDSARSYVITTGINFSIDELKKKEYEIYPNPSSGELNVRSNDEIISLEVYDLSGRELFRSNERCFSKKFNIELAPGTYLVKVHSSTGKSVRKLIIY